MLRSGPLFLQAVFNLSPFGHISRPRHSQLPHSAFTYLWRRLRELTAVSVSGERADRGKRTAHVCRDAVLWAGGVTRMLWHHLAKTLAVSGGVMTRMVKVHGAQWSTGRAWRWNIPQITRSLGLGGWREVVIVASWSVVFTLIIWRDEISGLSVIVHHLHHLYHVNHQYFTLSNEIFEKYSLKGKLT